MLAIVKSSVATKFIARWSDMFCSIALDAVRTVHCVDEKTVRQRHRFLSILFFAENPRPLIFFILFGCLFVVVYNIAGSRGD